MSEQAEWTVLVFLNAKNNLEPFAFPNFAQMASIGSTKEVNLVVEMGRPQQHYSMLHGGWTKTLRFHVKKGDEPTEAAALEDLGATNMGDPKSLAAFVKWGREKYPAKHTMLVIWNHGQGWRAPNDQTPSSAPPAGGFRYVSNDDDTGDKLYNRAIQDTLTTLLAGEKLDVIAFDACLMAMLESAYAFRGIASVLVASEELEPGEGWNYIKWVEPLVAAKGLLSPEQLGKQLVRAMAEHYGDRGDTTLSAVSLAAVPALSTAVSTFATVALPHLTKANIAAFKAARDACTPYGREYGMSSIDLSRFMEQIAASALDASVKTAAGDVLASVKTAVLDNHASKSRQGKFGSAGVSIYFPASGAHKATDPDGGGYDENNTVYPVEFVQKEQWAAFLRAYWLLVP
jgi:hypothetical protein